MVPSFFKVSLKRFALLLAAYSLTRLLFLLWNWPTYAGSSLSEVAQAFVLGWRFDTSGILFFNAILFLMWMLPTRWLARPVLRGIDVALFGVINFLCLGTNVVDAEYVNFIGKRTSYDLLFIRDDIERQSTGMLLTYWYFCLGLILLTLLLMWLYPRFPKSAAKENWVSASVWRFVAVFLIFTGMRGGYQFKPLSPMNAYFSTKHELGLLALNTPFNLLKTRPWGEVARERYFESDREAIGILQKMTELTRPPLGVAKKWNVVILILESFGNEYTGVGNDTPGYTPFFDQLAAKSFYFKYNYANARRSIEGVPAVLCGLPSIMEEPIITSDFSSDRLDCLPKILGQHGYSSYFLHGAHNGSMHFDSFSRLAGFENFVGLNEFPKGNPEDFDEYWGVLDEPMMQYATKVIDDAPKPVVLGLFSLSSHHPYYIPPKYRGKFPKGNLEIHESIGYADYSLAQFFKTAETKPWFNNTIFVVTADHTSKSDPKKNYYITLSGYHRVPLLIYVPGLHDANVKAGRDRVTQQIDIMPSVLDLLGIHVPDRLLVGQSVFDQGKPGRAYNFHPSTYWYIDSHVFVNLRLPPNPLSVFTHEDFIHMTEQQASDPVFAEPIKNLKAVVHYLNEGLVHNSLYRWKDSL